MELQFSLKNRDLFDRNIIIFLQLVPLNCLKIFFFSSHSLSNNLVFYHFQEIWIFFCWLWKTSLSWFYNNWDTLLLKLCFSVSGYSKFHNTCMSSWKNTVRKQKNPRIPTVLTAKPISIFSPTVIWILSPKRAFIPLSLSLFISCVCTSYSMNGNKLLMEVAFASAWAFFFRRHNLATQTSTERAFMDLWRLKEITGYFEFFFPSLYNLIQLLFNSSRLLQQ